MIMSLENKSSFEIGTLKDEKEKELQKANEFLSTVKQERLRLQRQKIDISMKIKDLEIAEEKARHNVQAIGSDIKLMTNAFWNAKNGGL